MIAAALLPPLVALVFISIWRIASLLILFLRATRKDRQPIYTTESSREAAQALLEKARLEHEEELDKDALSRVGMVTMSWPACVDYHSVDQRAHELRFWAATRKELH